MPLGERVIMKTLFSTIAIVAIGLMTYSAVPTSLKAQGRQQVLAQRILSGGAMARATALQEVAALQPTNVGPDLRGALFSALARESRSHSDNYWADHRGVAIQPLEDPEFIIRLVEVVVALKDPAAIPALASALGIGSTASVRALADFGESAAPAVLSVVTSNHATHYSVDDGLITLRIMVEEKGRRALSPRTLADIRRVAELHLHSRQNGIGTTLRWAIDLAIVLNDTALRQIVVSLATDRNQVIARRITDPHLIALTQRRAADRLAGIPPTP